MNTGKIVYKRKYGKTLIHCKVTYEQRQEIYLLYRVTKLSYAKIGKSYGISNSQVRNIVIDQYEKTKIKYK